MKFSRFAVVFLLLLTSASAQHTYQFLNLQTDPRAAALAGSFVSANDDPNAVFYNPAGIVYLQNTPVSFSFLKHVLDINAAYLSASTYLQGIGRVAAGIQYISHGTFTEADEFGNKGGEYSPGEVALTLGYANSFAEEFHYGANVKLIYSSIQDYSSSAVAVDLGLHYAIPWEDIHIGFAALNLGGQLSTYAGTTEDLPLDIVFGISKKLEHLPVKLYLDFHRLNKERDSFFKRFNAFTFGAEFTISKTIVLRLGYDNEKRKELKIGDFAGLAGFNAGFGVTIKEYVVDYAFSSLGDIGAMHRFGVRTVF